MKFVLILTVVILSSCTKSPEYYRNQSSMDLCVKYLSLPSLNIHQNDRAKELARRNENCSQYAGAAEAKRRSDEGFQRSLQSLSNTLNQPYNNAVQYRQGTHTYIMNGKQVTCTTTGTVTNCFWYIRKCRLRLDGVAWRVIQELERSIVAREISRQTTDITRILFHTKSHTNDNNACFSIR